MKTRWILLSSHFILRLITLLSEYKSLATFYGTSELEIPKIISVLECISHSLGLFSCAEEKPFIGFFYYKTNFASNCNLFRNHRVHAIVRKSILESKLLLENKTTVSTQYITKKKTSSLIQHIHKLYTYPLCCLYTGCPVYMFYWSGGCRGGSCSAFSYPRGSKW